MLWKVVWGLAKQAEKAIAIKSHIMKTGHWSVALLILWLIATPGALASEPSQAPKLRLSDQVRPDSYSAELVVIPEQSNFTGKISIQLTLAERTPLVWLNGHGLNVTEAHLEQAGHEILAHAIAGGEEFLGFELQRPANSGKATLSIGYSGIIS